MKSLSRSRLVTMRNLGKEAKREGGKEGKGKRRRIF